MDERFKGFAETKGEPNLRYLPGICETEVLNSASGDAVPATILNSRVVSFDADGIVKFDFQNDYGDTCTEVKQVNAGVWYHYRNVTKCYRYYKDTTASTAKAYTTAGALVVGMKLHR
jgi:hypothetical protein